jgi:hypothetical protein
MTAISRPGFAGRRLSAVAALVLLAGCGQAAGQTSPDLTIQLRTLNGSGVTGTVTFTPVRDGRTRVTVVVDQAGHPDMPAHIHPGTCDNLTPQPKYPLENVRDGRSTTEIAVSTRELLADQTAVNLHASVSDLKTYTACADIR